MKPMRTYLFLPALLLAVMALACVPQLPGGKASSDERAVLAADSDADEPIMATIVRIPEGYRNLNTDVSGAPLSECGIVPGSVFGVRFRDRTFTALLGEDYSDVPEGEWVGLIEENGKLQLAISFGDAAAQLGCAVGDTLYIRSLSGRE